MDDTLKREEGFQIWLDLMEERLYELKELLPQKISSMLDLSVESLNVLEYYILEEFKTIEQIQKTSEENMLLDKLARYFGEVARKHVKHCCWYIVLDDERHAYFGLPIIYVLHPDYFNVCPFYYITALINRNKGNFLSTMILNFKRYAFENERNVPIFQNRFKMPDTFNKG